MTRTYVEVHALQTVPPSNVNRDDTGSPKTAKFGGFQRARVSSQAWKRATRVAFADVLDRSELGVRTKRIVDMVSERIKELDPGRADQADQLAAAMVASTGLKLSTTKRKKTGGDEVQAEETQYLVFVSRQQIDSLANKAIELAVNDDAIAVIKKFRGRDLLKADHAIDMALFGRMVADDADLNVDACAQVAHAISVHAVDNEYDYFTAVDDIKAESADEDAGAGMIGTVEFNSSTLYRYATVDVDRLFESLGDATATRRAVEAFVHAFVVSMPTGKQNTFANRTLPEAVVVTVRDTQPVNLVGAFESPVVATSEGSRMQIAAWRLAQRDAEIAAAYGQRPAATWAVAIGDARTGLEAGWAAADGAAPPPWSSLPALSQAVGEFVAGRLGGPA